MLCIVLIPWCTVSVVLTMRTAKEGPLDQATRLLTRSDLPGKPSDELQREGGGGGQSLYFAFNT